MYYRLCVGVCPKSMAPTHQLFAKFFVIEDLAVESDPYRIVLIRERLMAAAEVYNTQPSEAKRHIRVEVVAAVIRAAMLYLIFHSLDQRAIYCLLPVKCHD